VDCTDPRNIEIISTFDDELTGGVHNLFIYDDHVYAVNNGIRFDVVNIEDPANRTAWAASNSTRRDTPFTTSGSWTGSPTRPTGTTAWP